MKQYETITETDRDGREVVGVRLSNVPDARAWLYRADYEAFVARHGVKAWLLHGAKTKRYVRANRRGKGNGLMNIAAEITGQRYTRFADGNTLNLRRSNLIVPKSAKRDARMAHRLRAGATYSGNSKHAEGAL